MNPMKPWCLVIFCLLCSGFAFGQRSQVMQDFYRTEQESWAEYIQAYKSPLAQSPIDVKFYHINADISVASPSLKGNVLCRFGVVENNTSSIKLNLRREFVIDSIRGHASSFSFTLDTITIALDRTFQSGDSGEVKVYYRGVPPLANNTKGLRYTTHAGSQRIIASLTTPFLAHYWWPCKDGPGDKPDSVYVDITIPDTSIAGIPVVAVSNGVLANVTSAGGKRTFFWRERYPIVPYYVMAAISNYRDFHQTFVGTQGESFPLDYYVFDEHLVAAQQGVQNLPQAIQLFSEKFGKYPFERERYGMTQLGFYGAIENQTNTIINNMGLSYFNVSVHELAHMWFGDMITCKDWHHGWLNEGFASYGEALWAERNGGFASYKNYMQSFQWLSGGTLYLQNISDPFQIFVSIIYDKGAYVLHMLRGVLGDSVFFNSLSAYTSNPAFRYGHATTEEFKTVCEQVSGRDLTSFFNQWVYDQYYPKYGYYFVQNTTTGETRVNISQTQSSSGWRAVFEMPVQMKFLFAGGGDTTVTVWNNQQTQSYQLQFARTVSSMQFDPDQWILKTAQATSVDEHILDGVTGAFALEQNYPNPFNPTTEIKFQIPNLKSQTVVTLKVYDLLGREVATLVDGLRNAGEHTAEFNAANLSSGVYVYRLTAGSMTLSKPMMLLK